MNRDYFINKFYCELVIVSKEIDLNNITKVVNIEPYRAYSKRDSFKSKHLGITGKRFQNLWAIKSDTIISEDESITSHIFYFKVLLKDKMEAFYEFKNNPAYEVSFWIWVETDNAGIRFDLSSKDIDFINSISNRMPFSLITNQNI